MSELGLELRSADATAVMNAEIERLSGIVSEWEQQAPSIEAARGQIVAYQAALGMIVPASVQPAPVPRREPMARSSRRAPSTGVSRREPIIAVLKDAGAPLRRADIIERLGLTTDSEAMSISNALGTMKKARIVSHQNGRYTIGPAYVAHQQAAE
ncbi:MAG TPA: hypothetical protein VHY35_10570 [Stellaceae bacterium]|jgi:hypothetical protein|nr:hypothetical protein [Stellaceae bacterium]